ncbi:MAG TPA: LON peptidase substrate-binding domain-containing protein, partial [Candidatus Angelobacter sp.]|nr:LON peptidase substrate-binding domain-containing protein [Candidatus Angelobacter sp.]
MMMSDFAETGLPVLVLTDFVVFPGALLHVHLDRLSDLQRQAVDRAADYAGKLFIVKSRQSAIETSAQSDLHSIGVIAEVKARQPDGEHIRVAITAETRAELLKLQQTEGGLHAWVRVIPHVAVTEGEGIELFQDAMGPWEEHESLCYDADFHVAGIFSAPGMNLKDGAVLCDMLAQRSQVRIEREERVHCIDLQPLLDEL